MATVEYSLHIDSKGLTADFKLKYKHGRFHSIEQVRGTLTQEAHEKLMVLAPQLEEVILLLQTEYKGRVTWEKVTKSKESMHTGFLDAYSIWYKGKFKLSPKINGTEVKALKSIIQHLKSICDNEIQACTLWKETLEKWDALSKFYHNQTELRQINSNLNIILRETGSLAQAENLDDKFKKLIQ